MIMVIILIMTDIMMVHSYYDNGTNNNEIDNGNDAINTKYISNKTDNTSSDIYVSVSLCITHRHTQVYLHIVMKN